MHRVLAECMEPFSDGLGIYVPDGFSPWAPKFDIRIREHYSWDSVKCGIAERGKLGESSYIGGLPFLNGR